MRDPYQILGTTPSATDDEVKKAYRQQCKRYHPDLNPDDPTAEAKFKEVQAAYDQVMKMRQGGASAYGGSYTSQQTAQGNSGPYGGFSFDPFSGFGGFGDFFAGGYSSNYSSGAYQQSSEPVEMQAARNYINNGRYREALNALAAVSAQNRSARWYYYSAIANAGAGNTITARDHARQAAAMEPNNLQYRRMVDQLDGQNRQYQTRSSAYATPTFSLWRSFCLPTILLNFFCNCCCCC